MLAAALVERCIEAWPNIPGNNLPSGLAISASTIIVRVLGSRLPDRRVTVAVIGASAVNEGKVNVTSSPWLMSGASDSGTGIRFTATDLACFAYQITGVDKAVGDHAREGGSDDRIRQQHIEFIELSPSDIRFRSRRVHVRFSGSH